MGLMGCSTHTTAGISMGRSMAELHLRLLHADPCIRTGQRGL